MNLEKNQLFEEFERESWLYLDGDLPNARMEYWDQKLKEYPDLNNFLEEYKNVSNLFVSHNVELSDDKFDLMIDNAIRNISMSSKFSNFISNLFSTSKSVASTPMGEVWWHAPLPSLNHI